MTVDVLMRPVAFKICAALVAAILLPMASPAEAQQYGAPSRYGEPYAPPSGVGQRRAFDDTPRRNSYRAPPPVRPSIWQGLYVGGHGAYVTGSATPSGGFDSVDFSGGGGGLQVGFNAQHGNWVVGLEGDGTWTNATGSRSFDGPVSVDARANWLSSLRLRAGYAFDNVLVYGTAGAAVGNFDLSVTNTTLASSATNSNFGYVVGGGVEMKFAQNWSGRLEALYYGFNEKSFNFATGTVPVDLGVTTVRAGISYHFN